MNELFDIVKKSPHFSLPSRDVYLVDRGEKTARIVVFKPGEEPIFIDKTVYISTKGQFIRIKNKLGHKRVYLKEFDNDEG